MSTVFPTWLAGTTYLAGAVVTPAPANGTVWRATVAGTSAGAQPTWPTADPWTVTDGGVTWTIGTTFRQDVNDGIASVLVAFQAANPSLLRVVYTERPASLAAGELPAAWIDSQPETIKHANGIRTRTQRPVVGIADRAPEAEEFSDRINYLVDALVDAFTAAYHAVSGTSILQMTGIEDIDIPEGAVHLSGVQFTFGETAVAEGRT